MHQYAGRPGQEDCNKFGGYDIAGGAHLALALQGLKAKRKVVTRL